MKQTGAHPALPGIGEIHLWRLPQNPAIRARFCTDGKAFLSADEKTRLDAMKRSSPADRFLRGRVLLRRVMGRYLSAEPDEITLVVSEAGKPVLASNAGDAPVFSLSHSGDESVLAVAGRGDVGVDIESLARLDAVARISDQFYSPAECGYLDRCGDEKAEKALVLWCLKESIVKASGKSVWDGLAGLSLDIEGPRIEWSPSNSHDRDGWRLAAGTLEENLIIAAALRQDGRARSDVLKVLDFRIGPTRQSERQISLELFG